MLIKFFRFFGRDPELLMVRAPDLMDLKLPAIQTFLAIYGQDPYVSGLRKMEVAAWMIIFSIWRDDSVILAFDGPA